MDVQIDSPSALERKLKITVPADVVKTEYEAVVDKLKKTIRIDGFRPGKVPKAVLEKRYKSAFRAEAVDNIIPKYIRQALEQNHIDPAYQPEISELKMDEGQPLYFEADFEIAPSPNVDYTAFFELQKTDLTVGEEELEKEMLTIRKRYGGLKDAGRSTQTGDSVTVRIMEEDGKPVPENAEPLTVEIGAQRYLKEFEDTLIGLNAGEDKVLSFSRAGGKQNEVKVSVLQVQEPVAAEMTADFFSKIGKDVTDADSFKAHVCKDLEQAKYYAALEQYHRTLRDSVYSKLDFDVPRKLQEQRKEQMLNYLMSVEEQKKFYNSRFTPKKNGEDSEHTHDHSHEGDHHHDHDHTGHEHSHEDPNRTPYEIKSRDVLEKEALEKTTEELRMMYFIDQVFKSEKLQINQNELTQAFVMECYSRQIKDIQKYIATDEGRRLYEYSREVIREREVLNHMIKKKYGDDFIVAPKAN